ncbi:hypothetical protein PCE1_001628 [Barthelona sp. PCE]
MGSAIKKPGRRRRLKRGKTSSKVRARFEVRDIDEIQEDLKTEGVVEKIMCRDLDDRLPAQGRFFCMACDQYFMTKHDLEHHSRTKRHKKRLKLLKEQPYTQKEAEWASGMGLSDNGNFESGIPQAPEHIPDEVRHPVNLSLNYAEEEGEEQEGEEQKEEDSNPVETDEMNAIVDENGNKW